MFRIIVFITVLFCVSELFADESGVPWYARKSTLISILTKPVDSVDARQMGIWIPVERKHKCRVTVDIFGDDTVHVRTLFNDLLGQGYHNFYWDKKDDSGVLVSAGQYRYTIDNCHKRSSKDITVNYQHGELISQIIQPDSLEGKAVILRLSAPASVMATIRNWKQVSLGKFISDSLMSAGQHLIKWTPPAEGYRGKFEILLKIDTYFRLVEIEL